MERTNLEITRKSTKAYTIKFYKEGAPTDITGWIIYFTIKANVDDTDLNAKLRKRITEHLNATEGIAVVELTPEDTNITSGNYYYSIDYKDTDDNEDIVVIGSMKIKEPILKERT